MPPFMRWRAAFRPVSGRSSSTKWGGWSGEANRRGFAIACRLASCCLEYAPIEAEPVFWLAWRVAP
jgi:hypothetical protein